MRKRYAAIIRPLEASLALGAIVLAGCQTQDAKRQDAALLNAAPSPGAVAARSSDEDRGAAGTKNRAGGTNARTYEGTAREGGDAIGRAADGSVAKGSEKTGQAKRKATASPTMPPTQVQGIAVIRALSADRRMQGHTVSVGIMPGSGDVSLNGTVTSQAQRELAGKITRRVLPKARISNGIVVQAPEKR